MKVKELWWDENNNFHVVDFDDVETVYENASITSQSIPESNDIVQVTPVKMEKDVK